MTVAKHVFFLGLGGIGMSALARHLHSLGHVVGGYDLTPSPLGSVEGRRHLGGPFGRPGRLATLGTARDSDRRVDPGRARRLQAQAPL